MKKGRRFLALFMAAAMMVSMAGCKNQSQDSTENSSEETGTEQLENTEQENLIQNGDFSADLENWFIYTEGGTAAQSVNADGEMEIAVTNSGKVEHAVQPYYDGFSLETGCVYEFSFDVHSTAERTIQWRLQLNGGDYHAYVSDKVTINEEVQHISASFTMEEASDPAPRLCVNMGKFEEDASDLGEHSVYFDNFALYLTDDSGKVEGAGGAETKDINVNQIGYFPDAVKRAVVRAKEGTEISGEFEVINTKDDSVAFTGTLTDARENAASGEPTAIADFSELTEAGTYKIVTENYGESFEFEIGEDIYNAVTDSAMRMFYLQRCGMVLEDETFGHDACHTGGAIAFGSPSSAFVEVTGGWHDAGDYGRYTVAGAKAAADLLLAYENYGDRFGDDTGIPESGNGIADILDEAKYELDWLLQMQDAETGGVYHKITCENFPGTVMPEEETEQLILSPVSTTATADFAAVMAMAARVFQEIDADYQKTCLAAAEQAWAYLEKTENDGTGFVNPETIVTGEYGDSEDSDERYWALAELYKTTKEEKYLSALKEYAAEDIVDGLGWQNVGLYGVYAYLSSGDKSDSYYQSVESHFNQTVDAVLQKAQEDSYGATLGSGDYYWGSNLQAANNGMLLLMANQLSPNAEYVTVAGQQLDYLMGTNTNSYCFITGFGTLSPEHPHHRPSQVVGTTMPGMLIGGPNADLDDPYAQATLAGLPEAACYVDHEQSFSCNEVTIYWNSPLVYLLTGVEAE